jgi:hypothetical protein
MKLQKRCGSVAGPNCGLAFAWPLGDAEQQTDHQGPPQQSAKLFAQLGR